MKASGGGNTKIRNNGTGGTTEQSEFHGIVEQGNTGGTTEQQNHTKKYYHYKTTTFWTDNFVEFKTKLF